MSSAEVGKVQSGEWEHLFRNHQVTSNSTTLTSYSITSLHLQVHTSLSLSFSFTHTHTHTKFLIMVNDNHTIIHPVLQIETQELTLITTSQLSPSLFLPPKYLLSCIPHIMIYHISITIQFKIFSILCLLLNPPNECFNF